ncbi:MAG: hypothetical protein CMC78_05445 [Flavobacteriaceae bacterium]|nr:hypothetical protein [Flavobacteriaceae bacterium]
MVISVKNFFKNFLGEQIFNEVSSYKIGFIFFNLGLFFLLSAPILGVISILISIIFSLIQTKRFFNINKTNKLFLIVSIILLINTFISIFYKINQFEEWHFTSNIIGLFNWIPFFICFFLVQPYLKNTKYRHLSTNLILIGTLPLLITGLGEYYLGWADQLSAFNGNIIWFLKPKNEIKGLSGLFSNPNYAASWLTMIWPLAIGTIFRNKKNKFKLLFSVFYSLIILFSTLLTNSKDTLASLFIPIIFLINNSFLRFMIFAIIISLIVYLYEKYYIKLDLNSIISSIWNNSLDIELKKILDIFPRIDIWRVSLIAIFNKPLLGWGATSFPLIYSLHKNRFTNDYITHAHNLFFETSINYGLIFSILLFIIISQVLINSGRFIFSETKNIIDKCWWISSFLFVFNHMFDVTYYDVRINLLFWITLAGLNNIINENQITNDIKSKDF